MTGGLGPQIIRNGNAKVPNGFDYIQSESGIGVFYNQATGDVLNPQTGMLIFNVNEANVPTFFDGNNWETIAYGDKQQEVLIGGVYNDFQVTGNIINFTNQDGQAILTGFNSPKYKNFFVINNSEFPIQLRNEDNNSLIENQIKLPTGTASVSIEGTTHFVYIESIQKYQIINTFASRYAPEHKGLTEDAAQTVGPNSVTGAKKIEDLYSENPAIKSTTLADGTDNTTAGTGYDTLNDLHPNVVVGFEVVCENAGSLGTIYKLINSTTKVWRKIKFE